MKIKITFLITYLLFSLNAFAQDSVNDEKFKMLVKPESGIWWNSEQSGTGAAMQFGSNGTWFVALFLYGESGEPIFYTLQGQSVEYSFDRSLFGSNAYARVTSSIHKNVDGRCLGCDYQAPSGSILPGISAEILFINTGKAIIKLSGDIVFEETLKIDVLPNYLPDFDSKVRVDFFGNGFSNSYILKETRWPIMELGSSMSTFSLELGGFSLENTFSMYQSGLYDDFFIVLTNIDTNQIFVYSIISDLAGNSKRYRHASISEEIAIENGLPKYIVIR